MCRLSDFSFPKHMIKRNVYDTCDRPPCSPDDGWTGKCRLIHVPISASWSFSPAASSSSCDILAAISFEASFGSVVFVLGFDFFDALADPPCVAALPTSWWWWWWPFVSAVSWCKWAAAPCVVEDARVVAGAEVWRGFAVDIPLEGLVEQRSHEHAMTAQYSFRSGFALGFNAAKMLNILLYLVFLVLP